MVKCTGSKGYLLPFSNNNFNSVNETFKLIVTGSTLFDGHYFVDGLENFQNLLSK